MQHFWRELPRVRLKGDLLELPDGVFLMGEKLLGSRLVVRSAYKQLQGLADELYAKQEHPHFVVRGTPGIGPHSICICCHPRRCALTSAVAQHQSAAP